MVFGQVVIGPPGSGKTTYCEGMRQFLTALGRKVAVINLDPANDVLPYEAAADIRDLISLEGAAEQCALGPNGALVFCLEYLEANADWLEARLTELAESYVLLDMPGQVELYTCHSAVPSLLQKLTRQNHRLVAVHLVDAHHCADAAKYISVLLVTLSTMVQLEMPQVNLLSKVDLIEAYGELDFALDFYTDVLDPSRLLPLLEAQGGGGSRFNERHAALNARIVELIDDFSLVNFGTVNISDKESVMRALQSIDKANGYVFGPSEGANAGVFTCAAGVTEWDDERVGSVQERYMRESDMDELLPDPALHRRDPR
jgi:GPN-loop GTPase